MASWAFTGGPPPAAQSGPTIPSDPAVSHSRDEMRSSIPSNMAVRSIRLRYATTCPSCTAALEVGTEAAWDPLTKKATCLVCADVEPDCGVAGASAQRVADQRRARRERELTARFPRAGKYVDRLLPEPASTTAWATGAEGERALAAKLEQGLPESISVLHDRRVPGSRANIDHIVVAPSGIYVVDAKKYAGQIRRRDAGGLFSIDERLYVGRRDCTKLVTAMAFQHRAVRQALAMDSIEITAVLCFVGAEWPLFARPFEIDGVLVTWPRALVDRINRPGSLAKSDLVRVARVLASRLPSK